jgi:hypothetical protein
MTGLWHTGHGFLLEVFSTVFTYDILVIPYMSQVYVVVSYLSNGQAPQSCTSLSTQQAALFQIKSGHEMYEVQSSIHIFAN